MTLLPGQQIINGASSFVFGTNMSQDFSAQTVRNNVTMQNKIAAGGFTLMRCAIPAGSSNSYIDETVNACQTMKCAMLVILIHDNASWNQSLVTYLGSRCNLYEFGNEPDLYPSTVDASGHPANSPQAYYYWWSNNIPTLRGINPNAAFIGPVLGVFANASSFVTPWLTSCVSAGGGMVPDAISFHVYPCTGTQSSATCSPKSGNFSSCYTQMDTLVSGIVGSSLPLCLTEWNIDANFSSANPYITDPTFVVPWVHGALDNMVSAGYAIACQWDAGGGAGSSYTSADLVSTVSPYNTRIEYSPMVDKIKQYLTPTPPLPDNPYMVKVGQTAPGGSDATVSSQLFTDITTLGATWLFFQVPWNQIDQTGLTTQVAANYHWTAWDSAVSQANAAGINIVLTLFQPPTALMSGGFVTPAHFATFASQVAAAYTSGSSSQRGTKTIQGLYIGNEDYDQGGTGGDPAQLVSALKSVYPAIKAVNTSIKVIAGAKLQRNQSFYLSWFDTLLNPTTGAYIGGTFQADAITFHYHTASPQNPDGSCISLDPSQTVVASFGTIPSWQLSWQLIQQKMQQYSLTVDVWADENGENVNTNPGRPPQSVISSATRWTHINYELDSARRSGVVKKYGIFTIGEYTGYPAPNYRDGESIVQGPSGSPVYDATYTGMQTYISTFPSWAVGTTSSNSALQQPFEGQSWILPDNSLILLMNAGTVNFSGTGTNHTIVVQSTNWQTASPTWTFVKQISTTANEVAASYWDGSRLHVAYANSSAGSASGLFYISATYASSVWTWDSSVTTLLAASDPTNRASSPSILVDSKGVVYVAYRNQTVTGATNSVCMFTKGIGGWNSTPVQMSATSGTAGTYYGAMSYSNNMVILVTVENATYYAQVHPDSGSWGSTAIGPTSQIGTGQQYGPVTVIADGNSGAWVGISSTTGLKATHLTWSGSVVTWSGTLTTLDSANNVSAPQWLYCNSTLYGYYFKTTSTNNADVYAVQYSASSASWSSAINLTNALSSNNVNPIVPANYVYSSAVPVMPYIWETGTASPFTINLDTLAPIIQPGQRLFAARFRLVKLLPGQTLTNNVSNFIFGTNLAQPVNSNGIFFNAAIQQKVKAGNFQIMRAGIPVGKPNSFIDQVITVVQACGCQLLLNLDLTNLSWNESVITYILTNHPSMNLMLYEIGNEPNGQAAGFLTGTQYYNTAWQPQVPTLRTFATPGSFFIGPVVTHGALTTTFITDWLTLCAAAGGTMLPDAISYHHYACTGLANQNNCTPLSTVFSQNYATVDGFCTSVLGYSLPQCLTEWNIGGGNPPPSYTQDPNYATPWIHTAIDNMIQAGFAMACQFEAGTGEGGTLSNGAGGLDMIYAVSPYSPGPDYQPIVDKNIQYLQHAAPGAPLLTANRRSGAGLAAINRRDGTGTSISRRSGVGLSTTSRRDGTGAGPINRRSGTGVSTKRRG